MKDLLSANSDAKAPSLFKTFKKASQISPMDEIKSSFLLSKRPASFKPFLSTEDEVN